MVLTTISYLIFIIDAQTSPSTGECDQFTNETSCVQSQTACLWINGLCKCATNAPLDILFGVDTSGSIGYDGFQIQKAFLRSLVQQEISSDNTRIGFTMFNTEINRSRELQFWNDTDLSTYVEGIYWTAGWTNTPQLISSSLDEFEQRGDPNREKVLMILTDGNPCLPDSMGGCPQTVCQYEVQVKSAGIRTVIIGVGDGLNDQFVSCLLETDDDFIPVASFSTTDFDGIKGSLSSIVCPLPPTEGPTAMPSVEPTLEPTTSEPTLEPTTSDPTTSEPTTASPTTGQPTIGSGGCNQFMDELSCVQSLTACLWLNGLCQCASNVEVDILISVDASGSIGWDGFQIQKDFLRSLVQQEISDNARIGFTIFATEVNRSRELQFWNSSDLALYVDGVYWTGGWTNTPQLLNVSLDEFEQRGDPNREKILMILTDGNPCLPSSWGGCPQYVCQYRAALMNAGIRTVIIGVGDGLNEEFVECILESDDDFIPVASFSTADFDSIKGSLSAIVCPLPPTEEPTTAMPTTATPTTGAPTTPEPTTGIPTTGQPTIDTTGECDQFTDETSCVESQTACLWLNGLCKCATNVQLDILFGVDTSGSIGYDGFQIQKNFLRSLIQQEISSDARIGFSMFSTVVNRSRELQFWDNTELSNYVDGIWWSAGWTNTPELLNTSLDEFEKRGDPNREKVLMILTDGNPCLPSSMGGCPQDVCNYTQPIMDAGIRTVIIGVGDGLNDQFVKCILQSEDDFIPVSSFSDDDFNSIKGSLSSIVCPIPPTQEPTTAMPTTAEPTTTEPTTAEPTTGMPTTAAPTTSEPTTAIPTTGQPTSIRTGGCDQFMDELSCVQSPTACLWVNGLCRCATGVELDILISVDASGSIGWDGFQVQKDFLRSLVEQEISDNARIGFNIFATEVNRSRELQFWNDTDLSKYVEGIYWTAGWTNTPELLNVSLDEFEQRGDPNREKILMILTDGNPCLPSSMGGCPQSVCNYTEAIMDAGIRTVIIGVGDGLNDEFVKCLLESDDDFIPVASFSTTDFDNIKGSLSNILCPLVPTEEPTTAMPTTAIPTTMPTVEPTTIEPTVTDISTSGMGTSEIVMVESAAMSTTDDLLVNDSSSWRYEWMMGLIIMIGIMYSMM